MEEFPPIIDKIINAEPNTFVIFFVYGCPYSSRALELLRTNNLPYKGYDIDSIKGSMRKLLEVLTRYHYH